MIQEYNQIREKFFRDIRMMFPKSSDIQIEITIDNISKEEFKQIPLPQKEETLFGTLQYLSADTRNEDESKIDSFKSELY
jgi:hypothetical protein